MTTNGVEYAVVHLATTYPAAAKRFMATSPDDTATYVIKIDGHQSKHLNTRRNPLKIDQIYIPLKKRETPNKINGRRP
jgi:hypothetical protein